MLENPLADHRIELGPGRLFEDLRTFRLIRRKELVELPLREHHRPLKLTKRQADLLGDHPLRVAGAMFAEVLARCDVKQAYLHPLKRCTGPATGASLFPTGAEAASVTGEFNFRPCRSATTRHDLITVPRHILANGPAIERQRNRIEDRSLPRTRVPSYQEKAVLKGLRLKIDRPLSCERVDVLKSNLAKLHLTSSTTFSTILT